MIVNYDNPVMFNLTMTIFSLRFRSGPETAKKTLAPVIRHGQRNVAPLQPVQPRPLHRLAHRQGQHTSTLRTSPPGPDHPGQAAGDRRVRVRVRGGCAREDCGSEDLPQAVQQPPGSAPVLQLRADGLQVGIPAGKLAGL